MYMHIETGVLGLVVISLLSSEKVLSSIAISVVDFYTSRELFHGV